jgi:tellurite resistance protein
MNEWAWSGSLALAFVCGATSVGRLLPKRLRQPVKALSAVCAVAVLISTTALWLRWPELSRTVVLNSHVTALIAPAKSAEPVFPLVEGEIVTAKKALRNFVFVRTADGRSGWVERAQIERVIPLPVPDRAG